MSPTRRRLLLASTAGITGIAGCSALSDPKQSLLLAVNNYTDSARDGRVLIEHDGAEVVRQYVEVPVATRDAWGTVETEVALGRLPRDTRLDVTAAFGDGLNATGSVTLNCSADSEGDALYVQIEAERNVRLNEPCYDEFPSEEATQGGTNRS